MITKWLSIFCLVLDIDLPKNEYPFSIICGIRSPVIHIDLFKNGYTFSIIYGIRSPVIHIDSPKYEQ